MYKVFFRLFCLILCCCLLLPGCTEKADDTPVSAATQKPTDTAADGKQPPAYASVDLTAFSDDPGGAEYMNFENGYLFTALPALPDDGVYNTASAMVDADTLSFTGTFPAAETDRTRIIRLPLAPYTGEIADDEAFSYPPFAENEATAATRILSDGTLLCTTFVVQADDTVTPGSIYRFTRDGIVLAKSEIPGTGGGKTVLAADENTILLLTDDSVCVYDGALVLQAEIPAAMLTELLLSPRGEVLAKGVFAGNYYRLYPDTAAYTEEQTYRAPENVAAGAALCFSAADTEYDAYFSDSVGFWGWHTGEAEAVLLCDWQQSGIRYENIKIVSVPDAAHLLVQIYRPAEQVWESGMLCREEQSMPREKVKITLGIVDDLKSASLHAAYDLLMNFVDSFNASNPDYFIEIKEYWDSRNGIRAIPPAFESALLADEAADIIVSSHNVREGMQKYADLHAFCDLSDAVGDVLLPCVRSAYEKGDGSLYTIPLHMKLSGFAVMDSVFPDGSADSMLTLDAVYDIAAALQDDETLLVNGRIYESFTSEKILSLGAASFADFTSGVCYYDSDDFARFLEFQNTLPEMQNGLAADVYFGYYTLSEYHSASDTFSPVSDAQKLLQARRPALFEVPIDNIKIFPILDFLYGEEGYSLHGYPTRDGEIFRFHSDCDIAINADSAVKGGAIQAIAYLLSAQFQNSRFMTLDSFPVTCEALDSLLVPTAFYLADPWYREDCGICIYRENEVFFTEGMKRIALSKRSVEAIRDLFYNARAQSLTDTTLSAIIEEELSAYRAGIRSLAETQSVLQSRLFIYINE